MRFGTLNSTFAAIVLLAVGTMVSAAGAQPTPGTFVLVNESSGIEISVPGINNDFGYGVAWNDYDNDGDIDLYVTAGQDHPSWLFQNDGKGHYTDVAAPAGCAANLVNGRGVKFADYDNDGDQDFFLANYYGPNRLYRNDGNGNFTNVAKQAGVDAGRLSHGGAWGDWNNDGYLDLYVSNYTAEASLFFHNQGDGTFVERAAELGIDDPSRPGLEAVWFDYDLDGDVDLYLSNDKLRGNRLFRNEGGTAFTDVTDASGAGVEIYSMGIAVGDYDNDGDFDLYVTNLPEPEGNRLLRNNGDGTFTNVTAAWHAEVGQYGWGTAFLDYDNDGDLDLYVVNWDNVAGTAQAINRLYSNIGHRFVDVTDETGTGDAGIGFGLAVGDHNNDGFPDMFVSNKNSPCAFYENVPTDNAWIKVRVVGVQSNRDGIGAIIRARTGSGVRMRYVDGGSSYLSQNDRSVIIGLNQAAVIDELEVTWPSGIVDTYENVAVRQTLTLYEGGVVPVSVSLTRVAETRDGVDVTWDVAAETSVDGYRVYRREPGGPEIDLTAPGVLATDRRAYVDASAAPATTYEYRVAAVVGPEEISSSPMSVRTAPAQYALFQNYPNPFKRASALSATRIDFTLSAQAPTRLDVFDSAGRLVRTLVDEVLPAGRNAYSWNGHDRFDEPVSTGVYFYRLESGGRVLTRKLILIK